MDSGAAYQPWPPPSTLWLEGIAPTLYCPTRVVIWIGTVYPSGGVCIYCGYEAARPIVAACSGASRDGADDRTKGASGGEGTCVVIALDWEKWWSAPLNANLEPNAPNNGGMRIFPDKRFAGDLQPADRRKVTLRASIVPALPGETIYFKVFDVDDPFDQVNNGMANVAVIDANMVGNDNRGAEAVTLPWSGQMTTDANGQARVTFTVSMQPGNNYRAVAATSPAQLATATQGLADSLSTNGNFAGYYPCTTVWSQMLTVWRKLHVETDSMVRPVFVQNTFSMPWNQPAQGPAPTQVLIQVDDPFGNPFQTDDDQFVNGYIDLRRPDTSRILVARIVGYQNSGGGDDVVTINLPDCGGGQSGLACLGGITAGNAILSDDDLTDQTIFSNGTWGCDDGYADGGMALSPPDLSILKLRYNQAYIEPVHLSGASISGTGGITTFLRNVDFDDNDGKVLWDQVIIANPPLIPVRNLPVSTSDYWTTMVLAAWQAEEGEDGDPNSEIGGSPGVTKGISTHRPPNIFSEDTQSSSSLGDAYTGMAVIFRGVFGETGFAPLEAHTVAHEIGHTFGLDHPDGGLMCAAGDCQTQPMTGVSLKKLREYVQP